VWEHNNLAQKNLTVVDLAAGDWVAIPFVIENLWRRWLPWFRLDVIQNGRRELAADLLVNDLSLLEGWPIHSSLLKAVPLTKHRKPSTPDLDCGYIGEAPALEHAEIWTSRNPKPRMARAFEAAKTVPLNRRKVNLRFGEKQAVIWRVQVPKDAKAGETLRVDLVHRSILGRCVFGGIALEIRVQEPEV
jgi:hypothetical protein